jgi:hypothetical protein
MLEPTLLSALTEFGKAALSDAVKESVRAWLTDAVRVRRAIQKTAFTFSTKLPGTEDALTMWVGTDAFLSGMEELLSGRALPDRIASVDEFLGVTGLGFGSVSHDVVSEMLASFYGIIRADMVSSGQGLVLVDNRVGEALRQVRELRADLAAEALSNQAQAGVERISREFLNEVALTQGWGVNLQFGAELYVKIELPPAVQNLAKRALTVDSVRAILKNAVWYGMYGGSGSGKTQLAILVAETFSGPKVWVRLGATQSAAALIVESALAKLSPRQPGQSTRQWCETVCNALGPAAVIILDDLPRTLGDGALDEYLAALCSACARSGVRLITTAPGPIASGTRAAVGSYIHEEPVPGFSEEQTRELFRAYDAPASFLASRWFGFVQRTAKRHPLLLVEAARYLQDRGWATDDRSFDDLVQGTFASSLDLPTIERVRQTVPKDTTREFLYRLKVIGWPFGLEEVQRISAIAPPIAFPLEQLTAVTGLWVQQDGDREYILSPLLARLNDANLPKELQQAIHLALARGILEKRRLGPLQATQAITHFVTGGDVNTAAFVLLVALNGMLSMAEVSDPFALTAIWAGMPLPAEIALQKRIYLRTLQVILRRRLHSDTQFEHADLERLMTEGDSDDECQLLIAGAGAILATHIGAQEPELAIRSVRRSIKASRRVERAITPSQELDLHAGLFTLLWMTAAWIQTEGQYMEWFSAVRDLTPEEVRPWAAVPFAGQASQTVCAGVWTRTADLPAAKRDWASVMEKLDQLKTWAHSANVRSLASSALSSQIIVVAEYQKELRRADALAHAGLIEFDDMPKSKFSIADTIARQHYYFGSSADAIRWFDIAFSVQDAVRPAARVNSLTLAGVAAHNLDVDLARRYLERGAAMATAASVGARSRVTVMGELGILLWNTGQHHEAYEIWSTAAQELIDARRDTKEWQTLFRLFGNCTGYFIAGERSSTISDSEVTVPFSGIFLHEVKDIHELYKAELDWLLPVQMVLLAEGVGAYERAVEWAARTKVGKGAFRVSALALLSGALAARDLGEHRYMEIIRGAAALGDPDETFEGFAHLEEDVQAARIASYSARVNLVALTMEVIRIALDDRSSVETFANTAENQCREYAAARGGSRLWSGMAEVFGSLLNRGTSWRTLWEKATEARDQRNSALQAAYGTAAVAVAAPREAVQIQLQIVPLLERLFSPTLYHVTVAKFVPEYWRWALDQYPMSFGLLNRTRRAIAETEALDDKARVHATLHAIAFSLAIRMPDDVQRWLDSTDVIN